MADIRNDKNKDTIDNSDDNFDLSAFSDDYMASVQEQMKKFTENPAMLQKAIAPFIKMQRQYMDNPDSISQLSNISGDEEMFKKLDDLFDVVKRIRARLIRLEKRLEESGVIEQKQEE